MTAPSPAGAGSMPGVEADYFDGQHARPRRVRVQRRGTHLLLHDVSTAADTSTATALRALPLAEVSWPERTRHGARIAHFAQGGELHALDAASWDAFVAAAGVRESLVVRSQQSWRGVAIAALLLVALIGTAWRWGVPATARAALALVPETVDTQLGDAALAQVESRWLSASVLPEAQQSALRTEFERALAAARPSGARPHRILFRASRIGPNAFALPGGTIVMTDELVTLVAGDTAAVVGVLAHEYGHVERRHGMRQALQAGLVGVASSLAFGDFSGVLAGLPALLGTLGYSRDMEHEADADAVALMQAAGLSPLAMLRFFEAMATWRKEHGRNDASDSALGIAFSSHPPDAERMARFRSAAERR